MSEAHMGFHERVETILNKPKLYYVVELGTEIPRLSQMVFFQISP